MTPPSPLTGIVGSLGEVAKAFAVSRDTVRKEWRSAGMPGTAGHYDLAAITEWKATRSRDPDGEPDDEQIRAMRRKKLELENDIKELERTRRARLEREADSELLPRKEVEAEVAQALQRIRHGLTRIPRVFRTRLPQELAPALSEELTRLIDQTLSGLVVDLQTRQPEQAEPEADVEAETAEPGPAAKQARKKTRRTKHTPVD